jgi:hypothetical protein
MAGSSVQAVTFLPQEQLRIIIAPLDRDMILSDIMIDWSVVWLKSDLPLVALAT